MRHTRPRATVCSLVAIAATLAACSSSATEPGTDQTDWNALSTEDLVARATAEGTVSVYSFTSRIASVEQAFEATYPGIDVVASDISSTELITRLASENQAGSATADVAYVSDAPVVVTELLADEVLVPYVPTRMTDVLAGEYREPLLSNRLSTKVLMYNEEANPAGPPVRNLWELTEPAWSGRVVMVDPNVRGDYLDLVTEMSLRADDMATAYQRHFGREIALDDGVEDAGLQFVADLYANDVVLVDDTDTVNSSVGARGQTQPPVGFSTYSDRRDNDDENWALQVAAGVAPSPGIVFPAMLGVTANAAHPAAARLLIDFMMGDDSDTGGPAYEPFYVPGDYPTRDDIVAPADALTLDQLAAWRIDPQRSADRRPQVADFLLTIA